MDRYEIPIERGHRRPPRVRDEPSDREQLPDASTPSPRRSSARRRRSRSPTRSVVATAAAATRRCSRRTGLPGAGSARHMALYQDLVHSIRGPKHASRRSTPSTTRVGASSTAASASTSARHRPENGKYTGAFESGCFEGYCAADDNLLRVEVHRCRWKGDSGLRAALGVSRDGPTTRRARDQRRPTDSGRSEHETVGHRSRRDRRRVRHGRLRRRRHGGQQGPLGADAGAQRRAGRHDQGIVGRVLDPQQPLHAGRGRPRRPEEDCLRYMAK